MTKHLCTISNATSQYPHKVDVITYPTKQNIKCKLREVLSIGQVDSGYKQIVHVFKAYVGPNIQRKRRGEGGGRGLFRQRVLCEQSK